MKRYRRGEEIWGQRDDGSWARYNRRTLVWEPQDASPSLEQLEAIPEPVVYLGVPKLPSWTRNVRSLGGMGMGGRALIGLLAAGVLLAALFGLFKLVDLVA